MSVTLSELSALQRIEHLALLKRRAEQAESSGNLQVSVEDLVRTGAFLVAMSLWHNHPQKTASPSMNEAVMQIEQEVLTTWPADAICPGGRCGVASVRDERGCSLRILTAPKWRKITH
ncbi:minor tail protein G [Escherichia coli]|uniref:Minor tail protein G n=1 Tax=Escherichia coli TaxID=562 RepID=A0A376ZHS9_ECOLX|nr:minor tail protein G [Escherichia coli]